MRCRYEEFKNNNPTLDWIGGMNCMALPEVAKIRATALKPKRKASPGKERPAATQKRTLTDLGRSRRSSPLAARVPGCRLGESPAVGTRRHCGLCRTVLERQIPWNLTLF